MTCRKLITYSPLLLSVLALGFLFFPQLASAEVVNDVAQYLFSMVVGFLGWFTGWAASFLNFAVNQFVINFGTNITSTGIGAAINSMWSVVRDFFNIIFIFAIIYIGFKMILGSDDSGSRRALVYLIIAALLVNFSLFISKFVVDFSNILAREVAVAAFPVSEYNGNPIAGSVDIGTNFFNMMQIPTTLDANRDVTTSERVEWGYIFGIAMVYIVAIFAFTSGAIMLVIRYAALCIYMVLSPLMFIGWVLPQYSGLMRQYWSGFLGRAFFAPVYIVLLYFSGAVIQASFSDLNSGGIGDALTKGGGGRYESEILTGGVSMGFGPFILSAVFLIMAVQVGNKLSADGAGTAMRIGGNLARGGRRRLQNGAMYIPRRAAAGGAAVARGTARGIGGTLARPIASGAERGRKATERTAARLGQGGWAGKSAATALENTVGAGFKRAEGATIAGSETYADRQKRLAEDQVRRNNTLKQSERAAESKKLKEEIELENMLRAGGPAAAMFAGATRLSDKELEERQSKLAGTIAKMEGTEVRDNFTPDELQRDYIAKNLTDAQKKFIKENGIFNASDFKKLEDTAIDTRIDEISKTFEDATSDVTQLNDAFDKMGQTLRNLSNEAKSDLGIDRLKQERLAVHLTEKDIEQLEQSNKYSPSQIQEIKAARRSAQLNIAQGTSTFGKYDKTLKTNGATTGVGVNEFHNKQRRELMSNAAQAGKLPPEIFALREMAVAVTPQALAARENNNLSTKEIEDISNNIKRLAVSTDPAEIAKYKQLKKWRNDTPAGRQSQFDFG